MTQEITEQRVLNTLHELNDCWTKGDGSGLVNYFHEDMVAVVPTTRERLVGRDACIAGWMGFAKMAKIHFWNETDHQVKLYGNTAIVTYYYNMSFDIGGITINTGGRDMFVFVEQNGKWWAVADQFSSFPD